MNHSSGARPVALMVHDYPPLTGGGLALAVCDLIELLSTEYDCVVVSSRLVDHFADDRRKQGWARRHGWRSLWVAARSADVLVVHWTFSFRRLSTLALVIGPLLGKPTVCVIHTAPDHCRHNRLRHLPIRAVRRLLTLAGLTMTRCSAVIALSDSHRLALAAAGIRATHTLPLPVNTRLLGVRPATGSQQYLAARDDAPPVIGIAGELSTLKGADEIPKLLASLTPDFRFRIVGRGPCTSQLRACVDALSSTQGACVELGDRLDPGEIGDFYRSIDCLMVCSRSESQCRVAIEAMLAGVVVLARPTHGIADLVVDGHTGFLVDPADPASVLRCLSLLREEPDLLQSIRSRAEQVAARLVQDSTREWPLLLAELTRATPTSDLV